VSAGDPAAIRRSFALRAIGVASRRGLLRNETAAWRAIRRPASWPGRVAAAHGPRSGRGAPQRE